MIKVDGRIYYDDEKKKYYFLDDTLYFKGGYTTERKIRIVFERYRNYLNGKLISDFHKDNFDFLSNFYLCKIIYKDRTFKSSEHAYQWAKFDDEQIKEKILNSDLPSKAKKIASENKDKISNYFKKYKVKIMKEILESKFSNKELREKLNETVGIQLIEGNYWHDRFWGICTCKNCKYQLSYNILGQLLMYIRDKNYRINNNE